MSVEAMSSGQSVATAPAVGAPSAGGAASGEMSFNSFSGPSAYGGTRMAGFDQAAFSETFQIPSPTPDSFEGGKFNPDFSALENTQNVWQAPSSLLDSPVGGKAIPDVSAFENTQTLWQAPEVMKDTQLIDIPEAPDDQIFETVVMSEVSLPQTEQEMEQVITESPTAMPDEMIQQEAIARVREAIKVEEILAMKTEELEKEIKKLAVETEEKPATKTEIITRQIDEKDKEEKEKPPKPNSKPPKLYFEHDTNADETRKAVGLGAIEKVGEEITDGEITEVTGQDIAEQMPNPQPKEVKSEIAKDKDGSYENLIKQLETSGTIYSATDAKNIIEKLVNENHAVRKNTVLSSQEASENEVKKVLGGQNPSPVSS